MSVGIRDLMPRVVPRWFWAVLGVVAGSLLAVLVIALPQLPSAPPRPVESPGRQPVFPPVIPRPTVTFPTFPDLPQIDVPEAPNGGP